MSSNQKSKVRGGGKLQRRLRVRGVRRDPPDLKKLSQALIALATAQPEAEAQAEQNKRSSKARGGTDAA